uniref:Uncharacterized protein n=1 Tax=Chromera velia CCMP2878 TaxID=1169474 RepID=A0A0G4IF30_9ALVE|eukprot:Cvel_13763.t1-p1 / transcript=Cvel_13763.t1 / gene=Cvel_13763 / organism=Chromera_velia_CCMP2878 / gene_product=hypothetical protein / transcript_product=hypothetical protein / location=Cvel_scaffold953:9836-13735(-) / protein_length=296 / sequence_SO=supercontig / SO=protein_coding / is_pseudo=false
MFEIGNQPPPQPNFLENRAKPITESQKFMTAGLRRQCETDLKGGEMSSIGMDTYFADATGILPPRGRAHLSCPKSSEAEWRRSRREVVPPHWETAAAEKTSEPLKKLTALPVLPPVKRQAEKTHIVPKVDRTEMWDVPQGLKTVVDPFTGERVNEFRSSEHTVENEMQTKQRSWSYAEKRNLIGTAALGDKSYKQPEFCPGFYQPAGLIPGSTFTSGDHERTIRAGTRGWQEFLAERPKGALSLTYKQAESLRRQKEVRDDVKGLVDWEKAALAGVDANYQDPDESDSEEAQPTKG